ncbi:MAG TPA: right-handed parallel beta-helix repeat-containing protein, partial [Polyangia bacterium]
MTRALVAAAALALTLAGSPARAATYYVATTGSDGADGSAATPWATLQHAADTVVAGDTVIVRAGGYAGFDLDGRSGTQAAPITFHGEAGAAITSDNARTDGINVENASWIVIEGFTVNNRTRAGIRGAVCQHVTFRHNTTDSNGVWGIFTGHCDDLLIEDNVTSRSGTQHGIYVSNSAKRYTVRRNHVWGNGGCGIHNNGDVSQGGDGVNANALIEGNVIHDNGTLGGSGINCDGIQDSVIRNNLLYANHASGISLYQIDGGDASKRNLVVNNTILEASDARWCVNIADAATSNTVVNNILYNAHSFRGSLVISADSLSGFVSDYNVVMDRLSPDGDSTVLTLASWRTQTGQDAHSLVATPAQLFVDPAADFHLKAGSPAIDVGTSANAPATDLEDHARPAGAGVDIGAYEY